MWNQIDGSRKLSIFEKSKNFFLDWLLFFSSCKGPRSKLNSQIGYQTLRILIFSIPTLVFRFFKKRDIKDISNKSEFYISRNLEFFTAQLKIDDELISSLIKMLNYRPKNLTNWGQLHSKGGIEGELNHEKEFKFEHFKLNKEIVGDLNSLFSSLGFKNFIKASSVIAGYPLRESDINFAVVRTKGSNINDHWHSDTFHSIVKGFIYLNEIDYDDSPFEYSENSSNLKTQLDIHQSWLKLYSENKATSSFSPRLTNEKQLNIINKNKLSFVGKKGKLIVANTAGLHRKGKDNSGKERIMLTFEFKRHFFPIRFMRYFV